jgi:hypothetical protein
MERWMDLESRLQGLDWKAIDQALSLALQPPEECDPADMTIVFDHLRKVFASTWLSLMKP